MIEDYLDEINVEHMKIVASAFNDLEWISTSLFKKIVIIRNRIFEAMLDGKNNAGERLYFDDGGREASLQEKAELERIFSALGYVCKTQSFYEYFEEKFTGYFSIMWRIKE